MIYEFNKSAVGSDLLISYMGPTISVKNKNSKDDWYSPDSRTYQGRMMTREWALIVRGRDQSVTVLLLPAVMVLAFMAGQVPEDEFPPFMELLRSTETKMWTLAGESIPSAAVPSLAKELLGDLIRVSSGVMAEKELFSGRNEQSKLEENLAVGCVQEAPPPQPSAQQSQPEPNDMSMPDAFDIIDGIVDCELKRLYGEAASMQSTSVNADSIRKRISGIEIFRVTMLEAFGQYTKLTSPMSEPEPPKAEAFELLRPSYANIKVQSDLAVPPSPPITAL
jgi:hypothetical protein